MIDILGGERWRVVHGDALDVLRTLEPGSVDAVVTDPPYGVGIDYAGDAAGDSLASAMDLYPHFIDLCDPIAPVILTTVGCFDVEKYLYVVRPPRWRICWRKGITSRPSAIGFTDWEPVFVYGQRVHRHAHDLFTAPPEIMGKWGHPCPKSVAWAKWLVSRFADTNGVVLDPFCGSGTVGVACMDLGRRFLGIEREAQYVEIARRRIADAAAQGNLFDGEAA